MMASVSSCAPSSPLALMAPMPTPTPRHCFPGSGAGFLSYIFPVSIPMTSSKAARDASFRLETQERSDGVTVFRREVKFAMPHVDFGKFRSILEVNFRRVSYQRPTSRVTSLYFDDAGLSACHLNLDGTPRRSKVRLRWYDTPLPEADFFFEVKKRVGDAVAKDRLRLRSRTPVASIGIAEIVAGLSRVLAATWRPVCSRWPASSSPWAS